MIEWVCQNDTQSLKYFYQNFASLNLKEILNYFQIDLNQKIIDNGQNFSLGQKQLIILLRLFSKEFKLILLDEVFSNITIKMQNVIASLILKAQPNAFFIVVAHQNKPLLLMKEVNIEQFSKAV